MIVMSGNKRQKNHGLLDGLTAIGPGEENKARPGCARLWSKRRNDDLLMDLCWRIVL